MTAGNDVSIGASAPRKAIAVGSSAARSALAACASRVGLEVAAWFEPFELTQPVAASAAAFIHVLEVSNARTVLVEDFGVLSCDADAIFSLWRSMKAAGRAFHHLEHGEVPIAAVAKMVILDLHGFRDSDGRDPKSAGLRPVNCGFGIVQGPDGDLVLDGERAWLLSALYMQTAGGVSLPESAKDLAACCPAPGGGDWGTTLHALLRRPVHLGLRGWCWPGRRRMVGKPTSFVTDAPGIAIVDGALWLEARWACEDRGFGVLPLGKRRDDLLRGRGRCACGAPLHAFLSNGRRSLRCSAANAVVRTCDLKGGVPMEWCERFVLDQVLAWLRRRRDELCDRALRRFDRYAGALIRALEAFGEALPLEVREHGRLADDIRLVLQGFVAFRRHGAVFLEIELDLALLCPGLAGRERLAVELDPKALHAAEHEARVLERDQLMLLAAAKGTYDLPPDAWGMVEPNFSDVDLSTPSGRLSAKTLLDGLLCLVATDRPWTRLPDRFGDPDEFRNVWKRVVYRGVWDDVYHVLRRHFPGIVDDRHMARFASPVYPRRQDLGPLTSRAFGPAETARYLAELDALEAHFPEHAGVRRDVGILRDSLGGLGRRDTAERHDVPVRIVWDAVSRLRRAKTVDEFRPSGRQGGPLSTLRKLDEDQIRKLAVQASSGLHPDGSGRPLTIEALIAWVEEWSGERYHYRGMLHLLRREGIRIPATVAQRRTGIAPSKG